MVAVLNPAAPDPLIAGQRRILPSAHASRSTRSSNADLRTLWAVHKVLRQLRTNGRRAISIVDTRCGNGDLLIRAARHARALGFVAIEARGFDASPDSIAIARIAARAWRDPGVGFFFDVCPAGGVIAVQEFDADILIGSARADGACELARLLDPSGVTILRG